MGSGGSGSVHLVGTARALPPVPCTAPHGSNSDCVTSIGRLMMPCWPPLGNITTEPRKVIAQAIAIHWLVIELQRPPMTSGMAAMDRGRVGGTRLWCFSITNPGFEF